MYNNIDDDHCDYYIGTIISTQPIFTRKEAILEVRGVDRAWLFSLQTLFRVPLQINTHPPSRRNMEHFSAQLLRVIDTSSR